MRAEGSTHMSELEFQSRGDGLECRSQRKRYFGCLSHKLVEYMTRKVERRCSYIEFSGRVVSCRGSILFNRLGYRHVCADGGGR